MISVFGSTGNVGGRVAAMLLESGIAVRALVRSPRKAEPLANRGAEILEGSMLNVMDVKNAMYRCDAAFLMTPVDYADYPGEEIEIGRNYASALEDSTINHVVYMSSIGAYAKMGIPHIDSKATIEDTIFASGVDCTFLRPAFFMDNLYCQTDTIRSQGFISLPMPPDAPIPMVSTEDIAYAAVQSLKRGANGDREEYDILGGRDYSMNEVAEIVSSSIGRQVSYVQMTDEDAREAFRQKGMSAAAVDALVSMYRLLPNIPVDADRFRVYNEFNFEPTTLESMINTIAGALA
ncbi:MAG: NmrA family NAD(P)-binding protein [Armatimonadota bacterium]|nr:NmrA family NAD(P)-binding protein [bacterium]